MPSDNDLLLHEYLFWKTCHGALCCVRAESLIFALRTDGQWQRAILPASADAVTIGRYFVECWRILPSLFLILMCFFHVVIIQTIWANPLLCTVFLDFGDIPIYCQFQVPLVWRARMCFLSVLSKSDTLELLGLSKARNELHNLSNSSCLILDGHQTILCEGIYRVYRCIQYIDTIVHDQWILVQRWSFFLS